MFEVDDDQPKAMPAADDVSRLGPVSASKADYNRTIKQETASRNRWQVVRVAAQVLFVLGGAAFALGRVNKDVLPLAQEMLPQLSSAPRQVSDVSEPFDFTYRGSSYTVEPQARYELFGLVVTHNNISGIGDAYHTSDSVDMKDVCVLWGSNIADDNFHKFMYWSEPWTCQIRTDSQAAFAKFSPVALSNNHLLSDSEQVQEKIRSVRRGDQIYLKGRLVSYYPAGFPEQRRNTSLVRTDQGNGACEVIFVDEFEILKRANIGWNKLYDAGKMMLIVSTVMLLVVFLRAPLLRRSGG